MKWQPIETVPRDGTEVLLCWTFPDDEQKPVIRVGYYFLGSRHGRMKFKIEVDGPDSFYILYTSEDDMPSFWSPINPPETEQ